MHTIIKQDSKNALAYMLSSMDFSTTLCSDVNDDHGLYGNLNVSNTKYHSSLLVCLYRYCQCIYYSITIVCDEGLKEEPYLVSTI